MQDCLCWLSESDVINSQLPSPAPFTRPTSEAAK
jgi:hypothetical protein